VKLLPRIDTPIEVDHSENGGILPYAAEASAPHYIDACLVIASILVCPVVVEGWVNRYFPVYLRPRADR